MKKKVTIQDIADALGISRNTVSKAINNSEGLADATREKILKKAVEMGYKQFSYVSAFSDNSAFKPLSKDRLDGHVFQGEIALLTTCFFAPSHFASLMLDKFQREMAQLGYTLNTHRVTEGDLEARTLPITFFAARCSGIICFEIFNREYAEMLCMLDLPILFVDAPARIDGFALSADQLYMDNTTGIMQFVSIMLKQGLRKIGWIGDFKHCQSFFERHMAFRCAMAMAGMPVDESHIICRHEAKELEKTLGSMKSFPEIFICANDFAAGDAMRILTELGKKIPDDIKICGFDDSPDSRHVTPRLTTVHIHTQVMAFSAAHLIISRMKEPSLDFRSIYTEADLILRESTGHAQGD